MTRTRAHPLALALALAAAAACAGDPHGAPTTDTADATSAATGDTDDVAPARLSPTDRLVRISTALRGRRPTETELAAVEADEAALPTLVDAYLASPEFGATVRDLHNDALLLLTDFGTPPAGFAPKDGLAGADPYAANRAIMEGPLRLVEHIVTAGRPYTELVTADYTVVSSASAAAWGLPFDPNGPAWQVQPAPDDRPEAGLLGESWVFQRHDSTRSNANRGRANALARALLCTDFLDRDLEIDSSVNLADPDVVADAVQDNPTCAACHQTLDPLAAFFWGYKPAIVPAIVDYPIDPYVNNYFSNVMQVERRDPHYFGAPGASLADLGKLMIRDPRFSLCAARRALAYFHQLDLDDVSPDDARALQGVLLDSSYDYRQMIRALVLADEFSRADVRLRARPLQVARLVEDITGFRWRADLSAFGVGTVDLFEDGLIGYHVLAGGIDSIFVTRPSYTYSATASLTLRTLARQAANVVVEADFAVDDKAARRLFTLVSAVDTGQAKLRPQIVLLHRRLFGRALADDDPEVDETLALFKGALELAPGDAERAWKITLTALLQDVRIAFY